MAGSGKLLSVCGGRQRAGAFGDAFRSAGRDERRQEHGFDAQTVGMVWRGLGREVADVAPRAVAHDAPQPGAGMEYSPRCR